MVKKGSKFGVYDYKGNCLIKPEHTRANIKLLLRYWNVSPVK